MRRELVFRLAMVSETCQRRLCASAKNATVASRLRSVYDAAKRNVDEIVPRSRVHPRAVFVNNEIDLSSVQIYGFDYDYTLAVYKRELNNLIYRLAVERLVSHYNYPPDLLAIPYDLEWAIRGLHYDVQKSCLLKVDAFSHIQKGTVHRGRRKLTDDEIYKLYGSYYLPEAKGREFPQLIDLFSLPWAGLLSTAVQYMDEMNIRCDPSVLHDDIAASVGYVHTSGQLYSEVSADLERYVHKNNGLGEYLTKLVNAGKQLFMVTNSPFHFMNAGMEFMLGSDWRRLFTHIIVQSKKPSFFHGSSPFREYDETTGKLHYHIVGKLQQGKIYAGGNIDELAAKAEFGTKGVLYFGDHIYTDLADPMLRLGWHTAAIVPELAREIRTQNSEEYREKITWLETLTLLIEEEKAAVAANPDAVQIVQQWQEEREHLREEVKVMFNPQFGSLFRTYSQMTFFSRRLCRLADVYTSRLPNLLAYDVNQSFFPRRNALPHESLNAVPTVSRQYVGKITSGLAKDSSTPSTVSRQYVGKITSCLAKDSSTPSS